MENVCTLGIFSFRLIIIFSYNGILFGEVFTEEMVYTGHGTKSGQHHVQLGEEQFWILDASASVDRHEPAGVRSAARQRNSRAGVADLRQVPKVPVLEVVHADKLLNCLEALRLTAVLGDVEQPPRHRVLGCFPPLSDRIDDHADPLLVVLLLLLQLAHGLPVDVVLDVDVLGAALVRLRRLLVHILSKEAADLRRLVK